MLPQPPPGHQSPQRFQLHLESEKAKAHQHIDELEVGTREWYVAKGNGWADRDAKAAAA